MTSISHRQSSSEPSHARIYLILTIAISAASFAAVFIKLAQADGMPPLLVAAGRMGLAAAALTPIILRQYRDEIKKLNLRDIGFALFGGFWLAIHFILIVYSLTLTSVMIVTVFINTGPIWIALLETIFLKAKLSKIVWISMGAVMLGSLFIVLTSGGVNATDGVLLGGGLTLTAALAGSGYLVIGRGLRQKISLLPYIWIVFGCGGIIGLVAVIATGTPILGHSGGSYFWLIMLTLIPQLVGHSGFNYALAYMPATVTSIISQSLTITAAVAAYFVFGEIPGWYEITGGCIIMSGVLLTIAAPRLASSPEG